MATRGDITIDWGVSPRIIEITSDSSEITIQDLYDTLRTLAAYTEAIDDVEIVDAGGKEGGIVAVTMTLFNAQLKFKDTGTPRLCKVSGGNLFAVDEYGQDISPIAYVSNVTVGYAQSSAATIIAAEAEWTQSEKDDLFGSVEGVKVGVWTNEDRRLTSRDIESEAPGEHLSSEEQMESMAAILSAIKGLGFESEVDALRAIRQLIEGGLPSASKAHFKI